MSYSTGDIERFFSRTHQTVRNWSKRYKKYLSESASPDSKGQTRIFTHEDVRVFALISEMTTLGAKFSEISKKLEAGERGEVPEIRIQEHDITSQLSQKEIARTLAIIQERDQALGQLQLLKELREQDQETIRELNMKIGRLEYELELERKKNQSGE